MTPARRITVSSTAMAAAGSSVTRAIAWSRSRRRRRSARAAPPGSDVTVSTLCLRSGERAGIFLEEAPGLPAVFVPPFAVEARAQQRLAEGGHVRRRVELQPALLELRLQGVVEPAILDPLLLGCAGKVARGDLLQGLRQLAPGAGIRGEPIAVPDMVGRRAEFLHLVELGRPYRD